jgi:hypothetical protein
MFKWLKSLFTVSAKDQQLANAIKDLYKTHDVTVRPRSISVKRKKSNG